MDIDLIVEASIAAVKQEALKQAGDDHHWSIFTGNLQFLGNHQRQARRLGQSPLGMRIVGGSAAALSPWI